jgi:hypothetical protein
VRVHPRPEGCTAVVLACSDHRFQEGLHQFLASQGLLGQAEVLLWPGGAAALQGPQRREVLTQLAEVTADRKPERVLLIGHQDCRAAGILQAKRDDPGTYRALIRSRRLARNRVEHKLGLTPEQSRLLERMYQNFTREGAGLQVMIYLPDQKELFARICGFFGRAQLSILEARIHTTRHGYALDTFDIHDPANPNASYREAMSYIEYELKQALTTRAPLSLAPAGRISRHLKHFPLTPEIRVFPDDKGTQFILEIVEIDSQGTRHHNSFCRTKSRYHSRHGGLRSCNTREGRRGVGFLHRPDGQHRDRLRPWRRL